MNGRFHRLVCLGMVVAASIGCGSAVEVEENPNILNPVTGVISLNGKAIPTGSVVSFHSKDGGATAPKIFGTYSAEENYFSVMTVKDGENFGGAPEGTYVVTVQPPRNKPSAIPAKFGNPTTSGLTVEIKPGMNSIPEMKLVP